MPDRRARVRKRICRVGIRRPGDGGRRVLVVVRRRRRTVWLKGRGGGVSAGWGRGKEGRSWGRGGKSVRGRAPAVRQAISDQRMLCRYWWWTRTSRVKCSMERVLERKSAEAKGPSASLSWAAGRSVGGLVEVVRGVTVCEGDRGMVERVPSGLIRRVVCVGFGS